MTPFLIIAVVLFIVNILFIVGSLALTLLTKENKDIRTRKSQLSVAQLVLNQHDVPGSLPQVKLFNTIMRQTSSCNPGEGLECFEQKNNPEVLSK